MGAYVCVRMWVRWCLGLGVGLLDRAVPKQPLRQRAAPSFYSRSPSNTAVSASSNTKSTHNKGLSAHENDIQSGQENGNTFRLNTFSYSGIAMAAPGGGRRAVELPRGARSRVRCSRARLINSVATTFQRLQSF
ncbi:hypothetical protein EVAR_103128_1 [Eumeta japonica]|uniref:Secreted protein n=1 Tax=Eumeta variegata TaxID=151549 RepID=A0A4C1X337_EUMVA|nr:hypothetical protein EVAR_103128_1 [Eumeta japonica]